MKVAVANFSVFVLQCYRLPERCAPGESHKRRHRRDRQEGCQVVDTRLAESGASFQLEHLLNDLPHLQRHEVRTCSARDPALIVHPADALQDTATVHMIGLILHIMLSYRVDTSGACVPVLDYFVLTERIRSDDTRCGG